MNKLIEQLAEQASHQSPDGYPVTIPYSKDFIKKFAELLIKDCAEFISNDVRMSMVTAENVAFDMKMRYGVV